MGHVLRITLALALLLSAAGTALAETVSIRLGDGSRWRGETSDQVRLTIDERGVGRTLEGRLVEAAEHYVIIETDVAGRTARKTIFKGDIRAMETLSAGKRAPEANGKRRADASTGSRADAGLTPASADRPGVLVLPLKGPVGEEIRHDEIRKIGEEADKYGPGQIIVLLIETNGGAVFETELIIEEIWELRQRHRFVAWIRKAISAGAAIAMACHEIYFMTEGTAGSVTTVRGQQSVPEEEVQSHIEHLVETAVRSGHNEHVARAMKLKKYMCSYDKDPETGEVTFYGDLSGEYVLSDANHNLTFTSSQAVHCGFADGIADTEEELGTHLDLPGGWHEVSDYGRRISGQWRETVERARGQVRRLVARLSYAGTGSGDPIQILGKQIQIREELLKWHRRAPNVVPIAPEALEREITELRKQLSELKRRRRGY